MKKATSFFVPANGSAPRAEKTSFNYLKPDFLNCLPVFIQQLKLRGLSIEETGGKIIMQIAHRIFGGKLLEQPVYTLINTETDFVAFLSQLTSEDVGLVINMLLDNLSDLEVELLVTFVLQQEHRERSDNFARGESMAGQLVKMISARTAKGFFNDVMINCVKDIEIFVERRVGHFSKYVYGKKVEENNELSGQDRDELTRLLDAYLNTLCKNYWKLPAFIRLECRILDELNFNISKVKVALLNSGNETTVTPRRIPESSVYVVSYSEEEVKLCYLDSKKERTDVDIDSILNLNEAIAQKSAAMIEQALVPFHNSCLKRDRKVGLINTRFIGYMIATRSEELFNKNSNAGLIMIAALNKLLNESLHVLATNRPVKDDVILGFITAENQMKLNAFYDSISYKSVWHEELLPKVDEALLVNEQKIVYIALLVDIFKRLQTLCQDIEAVRGQSESKKLVRFRPTNEARIQKLEVKPNDLTINIAKYCSLLNVLWSYRAKERELVKVDSLYRETMELCLIYVLEGIIKPAVSALSNLKKEFSEAVVKIKQSEAYLLDILTVFHYIECAQDPANEMLRKMMVTDASYSDEVSYKAFLAHTRQYLALFHPDFNLQGQIATLRNTVEKSGLVFL